MRVRGHVPELEDGEWYVSRPRRSAGPYPTRAQIEVGRTRIVGRDEHGFALSARGLMREAILRHREDEQPEQTWRAR